MGDYTSKPGGRRLDATYGELSRLVTNHSLIAARGVPITLGDLSQFRRLGKSPARYPGARDPGHSTSAVSSIRWWSAMSAGAPLRSGTPSTKRSWRLSPAIADRSAPYWPVMAAATASQSSRYHRGFASADYASSPWTKLNERILRKPAPGSNSSMARSLPTHTRELPARSAASRRDRRARRSARTRIDNDSLWRRVLAP